MAAWQTGATTEMVQQVSLQHNVFDYLQRLKLLEGAFKVNGDAVARKRILLVDDLYRSGATATIVAQDYDRAAERDVRSGAGAARPVFSSSNRKRFTSSPPPYPRSVPSLPTMRWQPSTIGVGF